MAEFASATVQRVQDALQALGLGHEVVDLGLSARTAFDAARAVGCSVAQICKSLVSAAQEVLNMKQAADLAANPAAV